MASIKTAISLQDNMSAPIRRINSAMNSMLGSWENLEEATSSGLDSRQISSFNGELGQTGSIVDGLVTRVATLVGAFVSVRQTVALVNESMDAFNTQLNSQIQLATTLANRVGSTWSDAYDSIIAKASEIQSKGIYGDEAMITAGAEFATYMTDTDAIKMMMDTLTNYAAGMTGGGALSSDQMLNYATNLGKIMTGAYDAMTKKGFEFSDAQKAVINGSATQTQMLEVLGEGWQNMSEDMRSATVIADIINESWDGLYEAISNTPEGKIIQLKNVWGDLKESLAQQVYPAIVQVVDAFTNNWSSISTAISGFAKSIRIVVSILGKLVSLTLQVASAIIDNWSIIEPIILGAATALGLYWIATKGVSIVQGVLNGVMTAFQTIQGFVALGYGVLSGNTAAVSAAQLVYNSALLACPLTWILLIIIAVIAALYAIVAVINKVTGSTISATGIISGVVYSLFSYLWNLVAAFVNFFANVWNDPIGSIVRLFGDLADAVLGVLELIAKGIDKVFGSDLANTVSGWRSSLSGFIEDKFGDDTITVMESIDTVGAFNTGYEWGDNLQQGVKDWFNSEGYSFNFDSLSGNVADIADSSASAAGSLSATTEDLKYLRDIAEQEAINRFTTAEVKVDLGGVTNNVSSNMDLDGVIDYMVTGVSEALERVAEGVHS